MIRSISFLTIALSVGAGATGCGQRVEQPAPITADISRIDQVHNDFPPGFTVKTGLAKTLNEHDIQRAGIHVLTEATLDPPHCLPAMIPPYADLTPGTEAAGVTANGELGGVHVTALRLPHPVPAGRPPDGCDSIRITSPNLTATAHRIAVPDLNGVPTTGFELIENRKEDDYIFTDRTDHIIPADPDYLLTAAVDDRTVVVIKGAVDTSLHPQQLFSDLLVKAVTAIRGQ